MLKHHGVVCIQFEGYMGEFIAEACLQGKVFERFRWIGAGWWCSGPIRKNEGQIVTIIADVNSLQMMLL